MDSRNLIRRLDWLALRVHFIVCPMLVSGFAVLVGVLHG